MAIDLGPFGRLSDKPAERRVQPGAVSPPTAAGKQCGITVPEATRLQCGISGPEWERELERWLKWI